MIKLLSLFSGIGAFESALRRCGRPYEVVNYCEIDPHASRSYSQIHGGTGSKEPARRMRHRYREDLRR